MAIEAEDVKLDLTEHEKKCDSRQIIIHNKIDTLARLVYIGFGIVIGFQIFETWARMTGA